MLFSDRQWRVRGGSSLLTAYPIVTGLLLAGKSLRTEGTNQKLPRGARHLYDNRPQIVRHK
jgi:hypothetical protein